MQRSGVASLRLLMRAIRGCIPDCVTISARASVYQGQSRVSKLGRLLSTDSSNKGAGGAPDRLLPGLQHGSSVAWRYPPRVDIVGRAHKQRTASAYTGDDKFWAAAEQQALLDRLPDLERPATKRPSKKSKAERAAHNFLKDWVSVATILTLLQQAGTAGVSVADARTLVEFKLRSYYTLENATALLLILDSFEPESIISRLRFSIVPLKLLPDLLLLPSESMQKRWEKLPISSKKYIDVKLTTPHEPLELLMFNHQTILEALEALSALGYSKEARGIMLRNAPYIPSLSRKAIQNSHAKLASMLQTNASDVVPFVFYSPWILIRDIDDGRTAAAIELWCDLTDQPPDSVLKASCILKTDVYQAAKNFIFLKEHGRNTSTLTFENDPGDICQHVGISERTYNDWLDLWLLLPKGQAYARHIANRFEDKSVKSPSTSTIIGEFPSARDLLKETMPALKGLLKERDLPVSGSKVELVHRVMKNI